MCGVVIVILKLWRKPFESFDRLFEHYGDNISESKNVAGMESRMMANMVI